MKFDTLLIPVIKITFIISLFSGCSGHFLQDLVDGKTSDNSSSKDHDVAPSSNSALNSISPTSTSNDKHKDERYIQNSLKAWKEETNNTKKKINIDVTESNTSHEQLSSVDEQNSSEDDNSSFTLQYYVDEFGAYLDEKERRDANKTKAPSHLKKLESMPGIGTSKRRR